MTEAAPQDGAIRVLVVDDHDLFRAGLASLLAAQPDIEVVAQASGGRMGVRLADELRPDVVLMDLRMPDVEGPAATREILERNPGVRVLVLAVATDDSDAEAALEAGAYDFIAKDTPVGAVAVAVRAAAQGVAWLSPAPPSWSCGASGNALLNLRRRSVPRNSCRPVSSTCCD